jgi:uncharacterized protein YbjT (DUF2867 family)
MYVVTGASGHTGSVVARTLLERDQQVRVVLRDEAKAEPWRQQGAEVVLAELDDVSSMTLALMGADGAYLMMPPPVPSSIGVLEMSWRLVDAMGQAVAASGIPHFVVLSSVGAQHVEGTGLVKMLNLVEREWGALGVPVTFLRASYFMENWGSMLPTAVDSGELPSFIGPSDRKVHMVATRDVGELAAQLLLEPALRRRVVELAGPEDYSPNEVADSLTRLLGRPVHVKEYLPAALMPILEDLGYSAELAGLVAELNEAITRGLLSFEHPDHAVRGRTTLEDVLGGMPRARNALPGMGASAAEGTTAPP